MVCYYAINMLLLICRRVNNASVLFKINNIITFQQLIWISIVSFGATVTGTQF